MLGRLVAILAVAQLVLLGFMASSLIRLEQTVEDAALNGAQVAQQARATAGREVEDAKTPIPEEWESSLRRIIREEIGSGERGHSIEPIPAGPSVGLASSSPPHDPARVAAVNGQLDYFISMGRISPAEMAALQWEIAGLDEAARRQIMGKLTGAMNRGALKGQL